MQSSPSARRRSEMARGAVRRAGSEAQRAQINVVSNTSSSSLLPMLEGHAQTAPRSVYVGKESVENVRLDQAFETLIPPAGSLFLKIDTQSYEREVLKGSNALMPQIAVIQVELSLVHFMQLHQHWLIWFRT